MVQSYLTVAFESTRRLRALIEVFHLVRAEDRPGAVFSVPEDGQYRSRPLPAAGLRGRERLLPADSDTYSRPSRHSCTQRLPAVNVLAL
jgi:hypothetical protein